MVRGACLVGYGPWGHTELNMTKGITHTLEDSLAQRLLHVDIVGLGIREYINDCQQKLMSNDV